jgi:hypothetical protein
MAIGADLCKPSMQIPLNDTQRIPLRRGSTEP